MRRKCVRLYKIKCFRIVYREAGGGEQTRNPSRETNSFATVNTTVSACVRTIRPQSIYTRIYLCMVVHDLGAYMKKPSVSAEWTEGGERECRWRRERTRRERERGYFEDGANNKRVGTAAAAVAEIYAILVLSLIN